MTIIRPPAVAGAFYPADAESLHTMIVHYLKASHVSAPPPKAIIVPHAGYIYSGLIAASAYALLAQVRETIANVVLLGPSHWVTFAGLAVSSAEAFATPLGVISVDGDGLARVLALPQVCILDEAHRREHSVEVQLPFLQTVLASFTILPFVVGEASPEDVGEVLETLWNGQETLIVISSDLSHYYDYATAKTLDHVTSEAIQALRLEDITYEQACGFFSVRGLLYAARQHKLRAKTIDLRNSGDTAGPRDEVVGYGAFAFTPEINKALCSE
jgi:AmmeMemoRadiSam system protein B